MENDVGLSKRRANRAHRAKRETTVFRCCKWTLSAALLLAATLPALAQDLVVLPPEYSTVDENYVDYSAAAFSFSSTTVAIGPIERQLSHAIFFNRIVELPAGPVPSIGDTTYTGSVTPNSDSYAISLYCGPSASFVAQFGQNRMYYCLSGGTYSPVRQDGTTLITLAGGGYQLTLRDGTVGIYAVQYAGGAPRLVEIRSPTGLSLVLTYTTATDGSTTKSRLNSVQRNDGYQLRYTYATNTMTASSFEWERLVSVAGVNTAVDYCNPAGLTCSYSRSWPTASYATSVLGNGDVTFTITSQVGTTTRLTSRKVFGGSSYYVVGLKLPTSQSADNISYTYVQGSSGRYLASASRGSASWSYFPTAIQGGQTNYLHYNSTSPTGLISGVTSIEVVGSYSLSPLTTIALEDGRALTFDNANPSNRLLRVTYDEGNNEQYAYDARGNVTARTANAKPGSGLAPLTVLSASYDTACSSPVKCNKPNWVRDALGNQTDITYDTTHGGMLTVTSPAVTSWPSGTTAQPQTRYSFTQRYAWYKNSSGSIVQASTPVWVLTSERICRTTAASGSGCVTSTDEVVTNYDYGPSSGLNNLLLRGKSVTADGATRRSCFGYDVLGNMVSETQPNAGLASCP
jgi:YD repeat-containing protein